MSEAIETITLAGGCFWCVEAVFEQLRGVVEVQSGYSNGHSVAPSYEDVCTGTTGHAEVVQVRCDPRRLALADVLKVFFATHDPTTRNRQGNDIGTSYRSAIFYASPEQKRIAEDTIADVEASKLWPGKVVTEVAPVGPFWEAEPEHQDYLERYPNGYTCHYVRPNWKLPQRKIITAAE